MFLPSLRSMVKLLASTGLLGQAGHVQWSQVLNPWVWVYVLFCLLSHGSSEGEH